MRIPCAKCGHLHDSTVTPFMYDTLNPILEPKNRTGLSTAVATGSFKCSNCGNENEVGVMWTVIANASDVSDNTDS